MALLTVKDRQRCLKALGLYDGAIDGLEGRMTSRAYADLQAKYFINCFPEIRRRKHEKVL